MSSDPACIFCKIADGKIPAKVVRSDAELIAFEDINPQAPQHLLVIPRDHIASANQLEDAHAAMVGRMVLWARALAKDRGFAEGGYRLVLNCGREAGQTVFHLHLHVLGGRYLSWPPG